MEVPESFSGGFFRAGNAQFVPEKRHADTKSVEHFIVEDLLDFPNEEEEEEEEEEAAFPNGDASPGNSTDSSTVTAGDSCNSSSSGSDPHFSADCSSDILADANFSGDLCVPCDDIAELEWLSNFVEESFSSEDLQKLQLISGVKARTDSGAAEALESAAGNGRNNPIFRPEGPVPGKARSKRSRAAPSTWSSRLVVVSPTTWLSEPEVASNPGKKMTKSAPRKKDSSEAVGGGDGRKCLHCATDKTPQWRTGPMGPKTLCNACGVRYKSGRLVPEYRPAASPTFVLTKHSNSHRKVMELRRQKELQQPQQFMHPAFDVVAAAAGEDFLMRHHPGPDFRQLI
ncbi:hypothetical protein AAC387_Pa05g2332 [Persea americana]